MANVLVRGVGSGGAIRAMAVDVTTLGRELAAIHGAAPTAAAALCRVAGAALLLGATVKGRAQVSIQVKGDGPIGELYAIADAHGSVRVSIDDPSVHMASPFDGSYSVGAAVGNGTLTVTRSVGEGDPYRSIVPLVSGEIALDMAHYFTASEQKPSAMGLGELLDPSGVVAAGGFLLQTFPGVDEALLAEVEERIGALPRLSSLLAEGAGPEDVLRRLLPDLVVLDSYPVQRVCTCSVERSEQILVALGEQELESLIADQQTTDLRCHFCNTVYAFSRDDVRALLRSARGLLH
ncbi:MAG: 33 kDa chaperonin [Myxococcales bacterium]